jgi:four helix bundle protein
VTAVAPATHFHDLEAWRRAHAFVLQAYRLTKLFPQEERFALGSQLRRAAVSIAANIAEGFRRRSLAEKLRFFEIALSSADECSYYLILAQDLGYADTNTIAQELDETSRILSGYARSIRNRTSAS